MVQVVNGVELKKLGFDYFIQISEQSPYFIGLPLFRGKPISIYGVVFRYTLINLQIRGIPPI